MQLCRSFAIYLVLTMYLGLSNGHLAIFHRGKSQPVQQLPYDAAMFTAADQQALQEGIPFSSVAELSRLLEDFTS